MAGSLRADATMLDLTAVAFDGREDAYVKPARIWCVTQCPPPRTQQVGAPSETLCTSPVNQVRRQLASTLR